MHGVAITDKCGCSDLAFFLAWPCPAIRPPPSLGRLNNPSAASATGPSKLSAPYQCSIVRTYRNAGSEQAEVEGLAGRGQGKTRSCRTGLNFRLNYARRERPSFANFICAPPRANGRDVNNATVTRQQQLVPAKYVCTVVSIVAAAAAAALSRAIRYIRLRFLLRACFFP